MESTLTRKQVKGFWLNMREKSMTSYYYLVSWFHYMTKITIAIFPIYFPPLFWQPNKPKIKRN